MKPLRFLVALFLALAWAPAHAELEDGDVLGPETWQAAKDLLPEEILEHYRRGDYVNKIADLDQPGYRSLSMPEDFQKASEKNAGRYDLSPEGTIIDAQTRKQPRFIMGFPFPNIDENDPRAATKAVWNHFYRTWYAGDGHFLNELVLFNRSGIERSIVTDVRMRMFDGAPAAETRKNPSNLLQQTLACVVAPADLQGVVSLTWRYRDAGKHDSLWSYVPGLRRARQVSPTNRSDGFMGSDLSIDDGPFFDGKPEDFDFRLLGKKDQLVLMDPYSLRGDAELVAAPEGGWRIIWKDVPRVGADDPSWQGLPWAPVSAVLARRPVWVVEAVPKDPNYLYGRIVLRFDTETFHGTWASKYDRADTLLVSYQVSQGAYYKPGDEEIHVPAGGVAVHLAENILLDRATAVMFPTRDPQNPADYGVCHAPDLFSVGALTRLGK